MAETFVPGAETAQDYRRALGCFSTGVTVVSCETEQGPIGITANSFSSVSLDPPLVLWSVACASARHSAFVGARHFTIHVMGSDQEDIATGFAREGDVYADLDWHRSAEGAPVIAGCLAHFECEREALHDAGDHTIVVGRVLRAAHRTGEPLLFALGKFGRFMGV
ncbi:NADH-FMN oxidoreductase RutF, flavin reductase (DIM6/NTAB) family [Poseidonocella pacifica]|uniref:NADH-FMN oxidoreductase RutF, flavin reductase (DIM6/NTAB) family n=1 Tax=Poseidonocella pacifica TaxID=871651 RepID=A0A1I0VTY5_9RHOB|nr:flavin reductase family protein [Poseidonocella pacifica]SFA79871.1 NADH-FMN oxidoreductase RutF, flavin reductase (DIM6/NTAB) family [Poseidonocella pacifica]